LRSYRESDAEALFAAVDESREQIDQWIRFARHHQSVAASRDWIIRRTAEWLLRETCAMGVWSCATGNYLGDLTLRPHDWESRYFELMYWLRSSAVGRGYMTEAVHLLTGYAVAVLGAQRVEIRCDERNARSAAVARRAGFMQEGRLRNAGGLDLNGELRTTLVFAYIPSDAFQIAGDVGGDG
jgi:RimJ/RimL family protein N-acetyltransferase